MLLITRRENEAIVINGNITVKVLEVRGGRVKLGFEFPAGSTVYRQELFAKIQAENQAAAQGALPAPALALIPTPIQGGVLQRLTKVQPSNEANPHDHPASPQRKPGREPR